MENRGSRASGQLRPLLPRTLPGDKDGDSDNPSTFQLPKKPRGDARDAFNQCQRRKTQACTNRAPGLIVSQVAIYHLRSAVEGGQNVSRASDSVSTVSMTSRPGCRLSSVKRPIYKRAS